MKFNIEVREGKNKGAIVYSNISAESKFEAGKIACECHRELFNVKNIELIATSRLVRV